MKKFFIFYFFGLSILLSWEYYWFSYIHKPPVFKDLKMLSSKKIQELDATLTAEKLMKIQAQILGVSITPKMSCDLFEYDKSSILSEIQQNNNIKVEIVEEEEDEEEIDTKDNSPVNRIDCVSSSDERCKYKPL